MGPIKITITETGATPKIMKRRLREIIKAACAQIGYHHLRYNVPKHFTQAGAREYGYTARKGEGMSVSDKGFWRSYTGQKLRKMHHTKPMVWAGESERRSRQQDIRATSNGVRIVLHTPHLAMQNPDSAVNMAEEMGTVSGAEAHVIGVVFRDSIQRSLAAITGQEVTVIAA